MADVKDRVKEGIDTAAGKARQATDQGSQAVKHGFEQASNLGASAMETARNVASSMANAAGQASESVRDWASQAGQGFSQAAGAVRDTAANAYQRTTEVAGEYGEELTGLIRRYPITSVMCGLGLGFLLGRTFRNNWS